MMLNLPIVNLFFKSHPWLNDAKKQIRFLTMHYVQNLIVTEKSTSSYKCFFEARCGTVRLWFVLCSYEFAINLCPMRRMIILRVG